MPILRDPTTIIVTPSPSRGVTGYVLTFASATGGQTPLPYDAGNPPPNPEGLIVIPMEAARQGDVSTGPFTLTAMAMKGSLQSSQSEPTPEFDFTPPVPETPPSSPTQVSLTGGHYPRGAGKARDDDEDR